MKFQSHFSFTKQQRNGIFLLFSIIVIIQLFIFFVLPSLDSPTINSNKTPEQITAFITQIDSLKAIEVENRKPKIYPFNPNFITDYKGYTLGMTQEEIDRLLRFRSKDKWINYSQQFQEVTKVSDSLLNKISPYFKFPKWIKNSRTKVSPNYVSTNSKLDSSKKIDLNTATISDLKKIYGIGDALSARIVNHREKINGFNDFVELTEVYGLTAEVIDRIKTQFVILTPRKIKKINLNTATKSELVTVQYIDYEIAHQIIETRTLLDGFSNLDQLKKVKGFPLKKFDIIKLSLQLN
ncbi:ComEA family DNA-binding protein [Mesoflavibacter profundi]|uniref:ComEA family DNA-binding protein n=1 Tax=Mesoflavibacter profundi TaxID=2708110 RepID=UPI003517DA3D